MSPHRSIASRAGSALLTLAALGGAVCIVLVLLAVFFNITLIMFKTGSMSPTIPQGSLAVVRQIPADQIAVGDVVTVDRQNALPVTHRVMTFQDAGGGSAILTLRGDANPADDPAPYTVTRVRLVLFSIPMLAYAVSAVSNPLALGLITVGAASLVTWAFWPRDRAPGGALNPARGRRVATHSRLRMRHAKGPTLVLLLAAGVTVTALMPAQSAMAAVTEETITGGVITLTSIHDPEAMQNLKPGVVVRWQVGVSATPPDPGTVEFSLVGAGGLVSDPNGLHISVGTCAVRWVNQDCASGATVVVPATAASTVLRQPLRLGSMPTGQVRWVLIDAFLPANPAAPVTGAAELSFTATGDGDTVTAGGRAGTIAHTGSDLAVPLRAALGAVTVGLALALAARFSRTRRLL